MAKYLFTTKNFVECTTHEQEIEAENIRDAVVKALYNPNAELSKEEVDADVERFEEEQEGFWIADNEELQYHLELLS